MVGGITVILRILLLIISSYGYVRYLSRKVHTAFTISILFSFIGSIMFIAGILNLLPETAWFLCAIGVWFAVKSVRNKDSIMEIIKPEILFFCFAACFFLFLLNDSIFLHYDNFSHWAYALKTIIEKDAFPNFADKYYTFDSYPLGSSVFIYYFTEIIGICPEWLQMWIQVILIISMCMGLFAFAEKKEYLLFTAIGSIFLMCGNIGFTELLVDTLLALVALSAVAFCMYYQKELHEKLYYLIPQLAFLVSIKNSGAVFAVLIMCYAVFAVKDRQKHMKKFAVTAAVPAGMWILWEKHVDQVFVNGNTTKHAMTIENYKNVFGKKSSEEILAIVDGFFDQMFNVNNPDRILLLTVVILFIIHRCSKNKNKKVYNIIGFAVISYFVYQIGTLGMYLFSMPGPEALYLAGYERYHRTILIFLWGLVFIGIMELHPGKNVKIGRIKNSIVYAISLILLFNSLSPNMDYLKKQSSAGTDREKMEYLIEEYSIQMDSSYLIFVSEGRNDGGYLTYLTRYLLNPSKYLIEVASKEESKSWSDYEYVILFEETEEGWQYMTEKFGDNRKAVGKNQ